MEVYVINFTLIVVIGLLAQYFIRYKSVQISFCLYSWLQLTLIAALRWQNGVDYNQYYNTFYEVSRAEGWSELLQRREEIGFLFFNRCMSHITENIIVYLFFYYGVMFALLMWYVYRYSEIRWSTMAAFIAFDYFAVSLCFMRQSMAMVIGLFAIEMMKQRKWYWAILLILSASLFHSSALILLLCLVFSYIDFSKKPIWIAAVSISALLYVGCDFILEHLLVGPFAKYAVYLGSQFMYENHVLIVYYPVFVFVLAVCFGRRLCKEDQYFKRLLPVLFLGAVLSIMSTKHYIIERMALYITIYNIRVVAQMLALFRTEMEKWNYQLAVCSAVLISISAFAFGISNDRYWILPYRLNQTYLYQVDFFKDIPQKGIGQNH